MTSRENGRENLLDYRILADDDLLQFALHYEPMLAEFLQHIAQVAGL
jgi:hypothetical protein